MEFGEDLVGGMAERCDGMSKVKVKSTEWELVKLGPAVEFVPPPPPMQALQHCPLARGADVCQEWRRCAVKAPLCPLWGVPRLSAVSALAPLRVPRTPDLPSQRPHTPDSTIN